MYVCNAKMDTFWVEFQNNQWVLTESEWKHCFRVMRKKPGDSIRCIDGKGTVFTTLLHAHSLRLGAALEPQWIQVPRLRSYAFELIIAPTKSADKMEWLLEKTIETGVDSITFLITQRTQRNALKWKRLQKIARAALKQSNQTVLPSMQLLTWENWLSSPIQGTPFFAFCGEAPKPAESVPFVQSESVCVTVGPEGDFTDLEIQTLVERGFQPLSFGEQRLRTETAALYAVTAKHVLSATPS